MVLLRDIISAISATLAVGTINFPTNSTIKTHDVNIEGINLTNSANITLGPIDNGTHVDVTLKGIDLTKGINLTIVAINTPAPQPDVFKQEYCHDLRNFIFESQTNNNASAKLTRGRWRPEHGGPTCLGTTRDWPYSQRTVGWLCDASAQDIVDACGLAAMGVSADDPDGASWKGRPAMGPCLEMSWFSKYVSPTLAFVASVIIGTGIMGRIVKGSEGMYSYVYRQWSNGGRDALSNEVRRLMAKERAVTIQRQAGSLKEKILALMHPLQRVLARSEVNEACQTCGAAKPNGEADLVVVDDVVEDLVKKDNADDFEIVEDGRDIKQNYGVA